MTGNRADVIMGWERILYKENWAANENWRRGMANKRKTLPKELEKGTRDESLEELQKLMMKCMPNAVDHSSYKRNIFGQDGISEEFARWLLEYGTDINQPDAFGYTPLHHQAMNRKGAGQVELYLRLGADIHQQSHLNGGPLHGAADHGCTENVKILLEHGADVNAKNHWGNTPLEYTLERCRGADIINKIEALQVLVDAGAAITEKAKQNVIKIGKDIEFRRNSISAEWLPEVDAALERLYAMFDVPPVPRRRYHDGISAITVAAETWTEQYQELWDYLVPGSGACKTVQGEVIRINGRVSYEILDNGGINWDKDFRAMLTALEEHLVSNNALSEDELAEIQQLISIIKRGDGWEKELNRLCELSVKWVLNNPNPIPLGETAYRR